MGIADVPQLDARPQLLPGLEFVWRAFSVLHGQRQYTFGPQPLQLNEMQAYLNLHGCTGTDYRTEIVTHLLAMDRTWLQWYAEQQDRDPEEVKTEAEASKKVS